uniref:Uncharacterized protein n=1 Tax=Avena sativa TaxID=4498 RepID=A0ACD5YCN7_AVESA
MFEARGLFKPASIFSSDFHFVSPVGTNLAFSGSRVSGVKDMSGGGAGNPMGDIFDDFVRQRFGLESYERCWRAASLLKHKVNRRESLSLAAKHLNYECNEDLAEFVYEKLRILKKKFSRRVGETSKHNRSTSVKNISPNQQEVSTKLGNDESIPNQVAYVDGNLQNGSNQEDPHDLLIEAMVPREKELLSVPEFHEKHLSKDVLLNRIVEKKINLVNMVFSLREKNIHDKQANEVALFTMNRQKGVLKLREACKIVVEHLRRSYAGPDDSDAKIKLIVEWFTMLLYAFLEHIRYQHEKLDLKQSAVWAEELLLKGKYLQDAKLGQLDHTFDQDIPLPDSGFVMEEFNHFSCCVDTATLANCPQSLDDTSVMEITLVRNVIPPEVINAGAASNGSAETFIQTERRQESEDNGLTEKRIKNSSDCIDSQGGASLAVQDTSVQHTSSSSPAIDSWINQQSQLRSDCSQEIEKVKQKYDLLLQEQESTHFQQRKTLDGLCEKVLLNQSLADDFRAKFISSSGAQGRAHSPVSQQVLTRPSAVASITSHASSSASRPPVRIRPVQTLHVDRPSSSSPSPQMVRPHPSAPGNLIRSTSVAFSHTPVLPRGSFGVQSELARAPAPHLQRRLSPRVHSMAPANQPQLPTRLECSTSARAQSIPVTPVNIGQSSLHPCSNPIVPAPLCLSSSHPAHPPSPGSLVPNPALQLTSPPGFTRVSSVSSVTMDVLPSRRVGPSPSGTLQSDSDSVSLDGWLIGSLGLSSDPRGSAAPNDVVCLSDDE